VRYLLEEIGALKEEVRDLHRRDVARQAWENAVIERLPKVSGHFVGGSPSLPDQGDPANPPYDVEQKPGCPTKPCDCRCYPCQCQQAESPCIDCPRVSTLNPYFNVRVFGALKADLLFNAARPVSPGTPLLASSQVA